MDEARTVLVALLVDGDRPAVPQGIDLPLETAGAVINRRAKGRPLAIARSRSRRLQNSQMKDHGTSPRRDPASREEGAAGGDCSGLGEKGRENRLCQSRIIMA